MKIAIMQPTFIPCLGYFELMRSCQIFVFLDNVQFNKRSWQQRNIISVSGKPKFLTVPVLSKGRYYQSINQVRIDYEGSVWKKLVPTLNHNYKKALNFNEFFPVLEKHFNSKFEYLSDFNIAIIESMAKFWGLNVKSVVSSSLSCNGKKEHKLLSICKELNATSLVSPKGSENYLDKTSIFSKAGIEISYLKYGRTPSTKFGRNELYYSGLHHLFTGTKGIHN